MAGSIGGARPRLVGKLFAAVAALLLTSFVGVAPAMTTGGAPTPAGGPPPPGSPTGAPAAGGPSAGALSIASATTSPRRSFYYGVRYPRLSYTIASTQPQNDLRIDVVDAAGTVVRTFYRNDVAPNVASTIRWDGITADGRPARNGKYFFQIAAQTGAPAARLATSLDRAQPRLRPLRLRLPTARRPRLRRVGRPLRRRPLRPHPPGPGRDGRLRSPGRRRPRRPRPVLRLPERRRQLRRHRRQGHRLRHRLHALPPTLAS